MNLRTIVIGISAVIGLILLLIINPFSVNDAGNRIVVQRYGGEQVVQFAPGVFYAGVFAKETEWPNQITVAYQAEQPNYDMEDNGIEVGKINIMFSDGTRADVKGITQFVLPSAADDMILLHNTHRTPQSLVQKRLAPFTKECLQSSAQLMTSDKHYGGGRAQMSQDFLDQLKHGVFLASVEERVVYDTVDRERKRLYMVEIRKDKDGQPRRKASAIAEYGITTADASIIDADYEDKVDKKLEQIIDAATKSAVSRQALMTAQQQALTAKAQGEQALVEIEYQQKQEQTKLVVAAETEVEVAKQDKIKQQIMYEASKLEALKIKELAEAEAYAKAKVMVADGALDKKLAAYKEVQAKWAEAFGKYTGNVVPQIATGNGSNGNGAVNFMEIMGIKAAKDLTLDRTIKDN